MFIVQGIVDQVHTDFIQNTNIILKETKFIKGCGPKKIKVIDFKNTGACGAGIPKEG